MFPARILLAVVLVLACAASSSAQFSSTKVVETGVNYPGVGTFSSFFFNVGPPGPVPARPSLSGTNVTFGGTLSPSGAPAFALSSGGTVSPIVVAGTTPVPNGSGPFVNFNLGPVGLSGSVYAFAGNGNPGPTNAGIFSNVTGSLAPVVNNSTPYPSGGTFTNFSAPAVSGSTVVFSGTNVPAPPGPANPPIGVFTRTGSGSIVPVANTSTPMPGGAGNFAAFDNPTLGVYQPNISGGNVVFGGRNAANSSFGLFFSNGFSAPIAVATNTTAIPNGTGNFTSFDLFPDISGSNVAFHGSGSSGQQGIYRWVGGVLSRVADRTTSVPGATGTFGSFVGVTAPVPAEVAISGDRVAFRGTGTTGVTGIYTDLTGTLTKVIATGDTLDGKTVNAVNISQFAFDGSTIAVLVGFTNGSAGVYTFTPVPEPTCLLALGVAGLLATRIRRRRLHQESGDRNQESEETKRPDCLIPDS
jgi:hypothetical protein